VCRAGTTSYFKGPDESALWQICFPGIISAQQPFSENFMARKAENPPSFPAPLGKLRRAIGLTTVELGAMLGMDNSWISKLENGLNRPSPIVAEKIAALFRNELTEMHLIYPERFKTWEPTEQQVIMLADLKDSAPENSSTVSAQ
jgi:putative transcriptional regulator